ncbi:MAG: FtsW/RodA/SpoVE family cell cycle protein, partial [Flavisolibacter sp.]|nr:FtsW/RodA/SpoVE family cell cycle protein [Flavisolibacter sp.]
AGIVFLCIALFLPMRRFTPDSFIYRMGFLKNNPSAAQGWQWAVAAAGLLLLTILFGTGPEGSGVKVNLFGMQPSELVKFLIIIFLAGFFAINEKFIAEYASWKRRWSFFYIALIAIVASILLFLILGDLGPAMVVCFTFIILFSFSRGDFSFMTGAVLIYVLAALISKNVWLATGITAALLVLATLLLRKQLSESAVMALVVIAGFLLLDQIPLLDKIFPGPVQRLVDRKAIWQDPWNNEVFGGDHIANSIWAMSTGGVTGQGIGEGFAKTIPEAHTDMILPSFGEEFGWAGIISVFILFLIYLHRSIVIGRQTGTPFLFYLSAGIGISTFVQFLLIAGGSTGALPLSGVALPFVSYGGSSLIMNLIAAGVLLSVSLVSGSAVQMQYITKQQDKNLVPALVAACVGILLLSVNVSRYLFNNKKWVVQPALVADRSGARMFSYNPRIAILMNKLQAGTLYDRNGRILATSKKEMIRQQQDSLLTSGLNTLKLDSLSRKRLDRYYPFAEQMFFWTGDANTGLFMGGTNGYFAEYEMEAELRGFHTPAVNYNVTASRFRENRFLPRTATEMTVTKRDYSVLAPLLLAGINSKAVEAFKQRNRDVYVSMDARLQTSLQQALQRDDSLQDNRVSMVVMEDSTGDVLASAMYPLPPVTNWEQMTMTTAEQNKVAGWLTVRDLGFTYATQPGSTAKLLTALAAFNMLGLAAAKKTILIRPEDLIRVHSAEPDEP